MDVVVGINLRERRYIVFEQPASIPGMSTLVIDAYGQDMGYIKTVSYPELKLNSVSGLVTCYMASAYRQLGVSYAVYTPA